MSFAMKKWRLNAFQMIVMGFALVILAGALLLMLPIATTDGQGASFGDALFTATSAVCVTGLVVQNTVTYWSVFGQVVVMLLIQIGGVGVITLALAIAMFSKKKIGLSQRSVMQEAIAAPSLGGIVRLTGFIIRIVLCLEGVGVAILFAAFYQKFGFAKGLWYAIFHAVSAFCNAGFDLMGSEVPFCSLCDYVGNPLVNIAITGLIVLGGIGFISWRDLYQHKWHFSRYRMQTKVILTTTAALLAMGFVYFFAIEFSKPGFADLSLGERAWAAWFASVTPRTAGFNTVDLTKLSDAGQLMSIGLMLTGGSPGSTAGGMKTTTVAVLFAACFSVFSRKEDTNFYGRRISNQIIKQAVAVSSMYLVLFLLGGFCISEIESLPLLTCLFESASAIGTVGLSMGITPGLCGVSRAILVSLMFFGRVGGLTLIYAVASQKKKPPLRLPEEKITVG